MIAGWFEGNAVHIEDGKYLLSYDAFFKQDERFPPNVSRMALSVYVQTWGMRLLKEVQEEKKDTTGIEYEDDMFAVRLHVTSVDYLTDIALKKRGSRL